MKTIGFFYGSSHMKISMIKLKFKIYLHITNELQNWLKEKVNV